MHLELTVEAPHPDVGRSGERCLGTLLLQPERSSLEVEGEGNDFIANKTQKLLREDVRAMSHLDNHKVGSIPVRSTNLVQQTKKIRRLRGNSIALLRFTPPLSCSDTSRRC